MKVCFRCSRSLPLAEFYSHPQMGDRHLGKCKECTKRDVKENYRKRVDQYKRYERQRAQTQERRAYSADQLRKRRLASPEKYRARLALRNAVRDGRLIRKPCEVCGEPKSQAHHVDYSLPLDVRWLCFVHHRMEHGQFDYEARSA